MKLRTSSLLIAAAIGLAAPAAYAQGCCAGAKGASNSGCPMTGMAAGCEHGNMTSVQANSTKAVFAQPVQAVYDGYTQIHLALAQDSLEGVSAAARAIASAVKSDSTKALPAKVSNQAEALANAKDLANARAAFKPLSESLIQYVRTQKVAAGTYYVAYCPMAKASWLQTGKTVVNPYMGKSMVHCGQIQG